MDNKKSLTSNDLIENDFLANFIVKEFLYDRQKIYFKELYKYLNDLCTIDVIRNNKHNFILDWFFNDKYKGEGRTTVLACVYLCKEFSTGRSSYLVDHDDCNPNYRVLFKTIEIILKTFTDRLSKITINSEYRIIQYNQDF